ncbi:N-acetyl-gamma-glutamyl-phosphate reductase [hydrothermal vent metagenome]|uniref:N-acetyl-gamma-glutamyl-phosphate reductase n=1 Tax=hydrothermal vent metagenome TaxID=652676 RepID=A0A3B1D2V8_9ZZZZ
MINVGIVGISGYSGMSILELLLNHSQVRVTYISANNTIGKLDEIWPQFFGRTKLVCDKFNIQKAIDSCDVIFLAVPHTISMEITPDLLKAGKKVVDLSGDYRLKTARDYKKWYGVAHKDSRRLGKAVYGLPELYREDIKKTKFVANPGCYPTAAILGLAPLAAIYAKGINSIIIDAKSGVSGAGRKAKLAFNFCEVEGNFKAYKLLNHQHVPEMELYLSKLSETPISINFVPHLLPVHRGILETIYVQLNEDISLNEVHKIYQRFYKIEPFVRILPLGIQPELKNVTHTNYCDIGLVLDKNKRLLVITSVIDNLVKGAAGQAVQNMNLMCGFKEEEGVL